MTTEMEEDYSALVRTIESIFDLRGIAVSAVYVRKDLMEWIRSQANACLEWQRSNEFERGDVLIRTTKAGNERVTMQPYGAEKPIPVKTQYSGKAPWKIVVALDEGE